MIRLIITASSAVALIFFVAFIVSRLLRSRSRGFSIRMQFFLALASIVGAFALGLGLLVLDRLEARTTLIAEGAARDEAEAIAALVSGEMESRGAGLDEIGRRYAAARGTSSARNARDTGAVDRGLSLLDQEGREVFTSGLGPSEPSTVFVSAAVMVRGAPAGSVRVVKRTIVIRRALEDMTPFILSVSIVLGVTAALAADLIGRRIARPIEALTDFAGRVSEGERRAVPPPPAYGREVQSLTVAIDSMRRQLEGRPFVETFAADLSHELKNPVAAIRASAEVLADGALDEPEEAARFVGRIREATTRIEALLGDLLSLARIEARGIEEAAAVDLGELARKAVKRASERGPAGARFELDAQPGGVVRGDPLWLARAVDNLLDNARLHSRASGSVQVTVVRRGAQIVLGVRNPGEIGKHVEKRLFRRFVTTREDRGGTGLGLAIVRAIAEAHSGSAECAAVGPPDVEFRISLPAA